MKKLLLALTAVLLGTSVAQAQSSVTIYGILDVGYIGTNYKGVGSSPSTQQQTSAFGQSAESSSRLGFKGNEDLGGGTAAIFTIETGLNPDAGASLSSFNTRQAFVGIRQQGVGVAAIGTQYTPIYNAMLVTDPGMMNNMLGDAIYGASPQTVGNTGTAPFANNTSSASTSDAFTVRTANTLSLTSDTFAGFQGTGFVTANNQNTSQTTTVTNGTTTYTGGTNNENGWGLGVNYTWQKLYLTANYQALRSNQTGTLTSPTPALWTTATGGTNTQDNQKYLAATYDFGVLKAYAQWINRKATDTLNTNYFANRSAQQIGVRGYWTPTIESWASVGNGRVQAFGLGQPTANFTAYQIGTNYWLSKRTNLYGIFGSSQTSSVSSLANATSYPVSGNSYAVGVRHTF